MRSTLWRNIILFISIIEGGYHYLHGMDNHISSSLIGDDRLFLTKQDPITTTCLCIEHYCEKILFKWLGKFDIGYLAENKKELNNRLVELTTLSKNIDRAESEIEHLFNLLQANTQNILHFREGMEINEFTARLLAHTAAKAIEPIGDAFSNIYNYLLNTLMAIRTLQGLEGAHKSSLLGESMTNYSRLSQTVSSSFEDFRKHHIALTTVRKNNKTFFEFLLSQHYNMNIICSKITTLLSQITSYYRKQFALLSKDLSSETLQTPEYKTFCKQAECIATVLERLHQKIINTFSEKNHLKQEDTLLLTDEGTIRSDTKKKKKKKPCPLHLSFKEEKRISDESIDEWEQKFEQLKNALNALSITKPAQSIPFGLTGEALDNYKEELIKQREEKFEILKNQYHESFKRLGSLQNNDYYKE